MDIGAGSFGSARRATIPVPGDHDVIGTAETTLDQTREKVLTSVSSVECRALGVIAGIDTKYALPRLSSIP